MEEDIQIIQFYIYIYKLAPQQKAKYMDYVKTPPHPKNRHTN